MVGPNGITVYRVVTVKRGVRTHVAVDGGMGDNLEVALYGQPFEPAIIDKTGRREVCDVVGRHCESGDTFVTDHLLVEPEVGDLLVIPATGAYTFTMSNNYNGALRPPVVFCEDGEAQVAVRRETYEDLLGRDRLGYGSERAGDESQPARTKSRFDAPACRARAVCTARRPSPMTSAVRMPPAGAARHIWRSTARRSIPSRGTPH